MIKKSITYTDFNGTERTEDFYFHLNKAELIEMQVGKQGGLDEYLQKIVDTSDNAAILEELRKIIMMSYGQRSEDGRRFMKNDAIRSEFEDTAAYSELYVQFFTNPDSLVAFIKGLVPSDLAAQIDNATVMELPEGKIEDNRPAWIKEDRDPTGAELVKMTPAELQAAFAKRMSK